MFSTPGVLNEWLRSNGVDPKDRTYLITDAGHVAPGFTLGADGVEFFVHSPFASRSEDGKFLDRNEDALALQATFRVGLADTRVHLFSDLTYKNLDDIVRITEYHAKKDPSRLDRLKYDVFKIPHHCSYRSLSDEKGATVTTPVPRVKRLYEQYGQPRAILVSTSGPIPSTDTTQPPHRQAAAYYRSVRDKLGGQSIATMEHPTKFAPKPLVITIGAGGATVKKEVSGGVAPIVGVPAPRAGGR